MDFANLGKCTNDEDYKKKMKDAGRYDFRLFQNHWQSRTSEKWNNCFEIYPCFVDFKHIDSLFEIIVFISVVFPFRWSLLAEVMMFTAKIEALINMKTYLV